MEQNQTPNREVVRGEYFSNVSEPAITFRCGTVKFSIACLKQLPGVDYVHFVIDRTENKLIIESCDADERDAIRWSCLKTEKRRPKDITCREFYHRIIEHMQWNNECRYKVFGKASSCGGDGLFLAFDLTAAIVYKPDTDGKISRVPNYPQEWGNSFGVPAGEHHNNPLIRKFDEDTTLMLATDPESGPLINQIKEMETENEQ